MVVSTTNLIRFFFYSAHLDYFFLAYCRISAVGKHIYWYPPNYPSRLAHLLAGLSVYLLPQDFRSHTFFCVMLLMSFLNLKKSIKFIGRRTNEQKSTTEIVQQSPNTCIIFITKMVHCYCAYVSREKLRINKLIGLRGCCFTLVASHW